ncbi:MAG: Fe-S cluster assembly protein SufD [Steroidobacteraceae bacterium]
MNAVASAALPASLMRLQAAFEQSAGAAMPIRRQALDKFMQRGFPTTRDENWKYTNLRRLEAREFVFGDANAAMPADLSLATDRLQLVFVDGHYRADLSSTVQFDGLRITSLKQLQNNDATKLSEALDTRANTTCRFVALNTALTQDGVLIELADNTRVAAPLFINFIWSANSNSLMAHPRVVIRGGRHSQLTVVEQYLGTGAVAHFNDAVTTVQLSDSAQLEHVRIQNENAASFHIGLLHAELAAHAQLTSHQINFGAAVGRMDINVFLQGAEATVTLNGLQFASGQQHHDTHTRVEHCVPHTNSNEDYRGIADQRGRVVFNGKVVVAEHARKTDAQQSSRNLLLAKTAEIDTKPELEIYNDDVKCAHGATVGQLDANALFYLRSRGLDEAQARALLTHAFADHIIGQLPVASLREELTSAGHARFGAELEAQL